jgi:TPR repeat protein
MNYNSQDSKIRRASNAARSVWNEASTAQRHSLLESLGVPKEEQDSLVSNSWHTLNSIAQLKLTSLQFRTKSKHDSLDTSLSIVERKDSAIIPERETKVAGLANSVAQQIVAIFNEKTFNESLVNKHHIEKDFNPGWNYQDSLSRWYALGIICLTRCSMARPWSDALPDPLDLEVYDASLDSMWVSWGMPVAIRAKVDSFMKESFLEIKKSFIDWDNRDVYKVWFRRYANRLIGANPSWEIRNGGASDDLETSLRGERFLADVLVPPFIARVFMETGDAVLKVVCPAASDAGVKLQHLPADSLGLEQSEQSPCISDMGRDKGVDKALLAKADAGDRVAQSSVGEMYFSGEEVAKDYTQAAKWSRKAAEQGDAAAQTLLGLLYAIGEGVPRDYAQAASWYRKAAEQGDANAQYNLGLLYYRGNGVFQDYSQAAFWFHKAAMQGYADAQYNLGLLYANGQGETQDDAQAALWYRKAAEQGHATAQNNLGVFYANGQGVQKNHVQASYWFRMAADQGNANAQNSLGFLYYSGQIVPHDFAQGVFWYLKAAEHCDVNAQISLGFIYSTGEVVPQDFAQAGLWYRKAAEQGDAKAQYNLGLLYYRGNGVPQDYSKAASWYHKAADQGYAEAQYYIGLLCADGNGVRQDYAEAASWWRKSAEQGVAEAQANLGLLYAKGRGVSQDFANAASWFRQAAEQGHAEAQFILGSLYSEGQGVPQDFAQEAYWFRKAAEQGFAEAQLALCTLYDKGEGVQQSHAEAYFWSSLAANGTTEPGKENVVKFRDYMRSHCSQMQISNVEERLASWLSIHPKTRI